MTMLNEIKRKKLIFIFHKSNNAHKIVWEMFKQVSKTICQKYPLASCRTKASLLAVLHFERFFLVLFFVILSPFFPIHIATTMLL